jgi:Fic family protein
MPTDPGESFERFIAGLIGKYPNKRITETFGFSAEQIIDIAKKYRSEQAPKYRKGKSSRKHRKVEIDFDKTYFTVDEVACILSMSRDTVVRRFAKEPGVVIEGNAETTRERRRYRQLRIPKAVLNRVLARKTVK